MLLERIERVDASLPAYCIGEYQCGIAEAAAPIDYFVARFGGDGFPISIVEILAV